MKKVAQRYALAMFDYAIEKNTVKHWQTQLQDLVEIIVKEPTTFQFFTSVIIDKSEKKQVLSNTVKLLIDREVLNFLFYIIDKRRINILKEIVDEYQLFANEHFNIKTGVVYSAYPLDAKQISDIEAALSKSKKVNIQLKNLISEHLISGVKVVIEDEVIDGSVFGKMRQLKETLLKESR